MELFIELLPLLMFAVLGALLFTGYPVAFVLAGTGLFFGVLGYALGVFQLAEFYNIVLRIFGNVVSNLLLVAIPMFIFMGTMLEKSGVARELLHTLQLLTRRVPGGLALSVMLLGVVMAATTGIIGASVVMMTLLALPVMLDRNYDTALATGTIVSSGTLGILIPPSIMLVIMGDLLSVSVGTLFMAAIVPGLMLAGLYLVYIAVTSGLQPKKAPPLPEDERLPGGMALLGVLLRSFLPPIFLIGLVLGSIFAGWATPTEASGVGAAGAILLALLNRKLNWSTMKEVTERSALTGAMLFGIFVTATAFSYVFQSLGGDHLVKDITAQLGIGPWGLIAFMLLIVFVLGFFLDWIEITLIVLPIFAPLISGLDLSGHIPQADLVLPWLAIVIAVNLQSSFLTPPFGFALFYLKGVAPKSVGIGDIYRGVLPFVALQILGMGLVLAFPQIALWLPSALLD